MKINCLLSFILISSCEAIQKREKLHLTITWQGFFATCYKLVSPFHISNGLMTTCLEHNTRGYVCIFMVRMNSKKGRKEVAAYF